MPEAAANAQSSIDELGIASVDRLKDDGQALEVRRDTHKMDVVGHQAIGQDLQSELGGIVSELGGIVNEELKIMLPTVVVEEDIPRRLPRWVM